MLETVFIIKLSFKDFIDVILALPGLVIFILLLIYLINKSTESSDFWFEFS